MAQDEPKATTAAAAKHFMLAGLIDLKIIFLIATVSLAGIDWSVIFLNINSNSAPQCGREKPLALTSRGKNATVAKRIPEVIAPSINSEISKDRLLKQAAPNTRGHLANVPQMQKGMDVRAAASVVLTAP